MQDFRHLHLSEQSSGDVRSLPDGASYAEGVWPLDGDLPRLASIETLHSLDLGECHEVTIFQPVPCFVQAGHESVLALLCKLASISLSCQLTSSM